MKKRHFGVAAAAIGLFIAVGAPTGMAAKPAAGKACLKKQAGKRVRTPSGAILRCVKVRGRYRWKVVKAAPVTPVPTPSVTPSPTTAARPGSDRSAPIPLGQTGALGDGWTMTVLGFTPDATAAVLAENMFNSPPPPGQQFAIARVAALNATATPDNFDGGFRLRAVGPSGVTLSTFENSCGVIPDEISNTTIFPGGTVAGNVCWSVPSGDVGGLVLFDKFFLSSAPQWTFFALH